MVHCVTVQEIALPAHQCRHYEQLLELAAQQCSQSVFSLKLYFLNAHQQATLIESDADLLALRYAARGSSYLFRVEVTKSRQAIEEEQQSEAIGEYLHMTYEDIAEQELQRELRQVSSDYLQELYSEIARMEEEQAILQMEKEEVRKCIAKISQSAIRAHLNRNQPRSKLTRAEPREMVIQRMVSRALEEMMPMMVRQLSHRIMEELRQGKFEDSNRDSEENPEEL